METLEIRPEEVLAHVLMTDRYVSFKDIEEFVGYIQRTANCKGVNNFKCDIRRETLDGAVKKFPTSFQTCKSEFFDYTVGKSFHVGQFIPTEKRSQDILQSALEWYTRDLIDDKINSISDLCMPKEEFSHTLSKAAKQLVVFSQWNQNIVSSPAYLLGTYEGYLRATQNIFALLSHIIPTMKLMPDEKIFKVLEYLNNQEFSSFFYLISEDLNIELKELAPIMHQLDVTGCVEGNGLYDEDDYTYDLYRITTVGIAVLQLAKELFYSNNDAEQRATLKKRLCEKKKELTSMQQQLDTSINKIKSLSDNNETLKRQIGELQAEIAELEANL